MDRQIVYANSLVRDVDILETNKNGMVAVGKLSEALFGQTTSYAGLKVTPTSPASLSVDVAPGSIYTLLPIDQSAYGILPAETTDSIMKQGINKLKTTLTLTPPASAGQAINYLVQAAFQESDSGPNGGGPTVLPYFNSANPALSFSGPSNTGAAQNTQRRATITINAKAGTAATPGTQTTPPADAGFIPLYVVTVAFGATAITLANITLANGSPVIQSLNSMAANFLPTSGGTLTGPLMLAAPPNAPLMAANKDYVDQAVASLSVVVAGPSVMPAGRLTLATGQPILVGDVSGASTIYYAPHNGNFCPIFNGTAWTVKYFAELSQDLTDATKSPTAAALNSAYDLYVWDDNGVIRLSRGPAWLSLLSRGPASALSRVNGVFVNAVAIVNGPQAGRGTYVGSIETNASGKVDFVINPAPIAGGGNARIGIWNYYNQVPIVATSYDSTPSWGAVASGGTWRAANGSANNRVKIFIGVEGRSAIARGLTTYTAYLNSNFAESAIGLDSLTMSNGSISSTSQPGNAIAHCGLPSFCASQYLLGSHYFQLLERAVPGGTATFYGNGKTSIAYEGVY